MNKYGVCIVQYSLNVFSAIHVSLMFMLVGEVAEILSLGLLQKYNIVMLILWSSTI